MKNIVYKSLLVFLFFLLVFNSAFSQLSEGFSDGDFTANPVWVGSTNDWVVNSTMELQSQNQVASSSFYLSTANTLATTAEWELKVGLSFSTSGSNYVDVFLTASAADLTLPTTAGYFVRIGNTDDEVSLYRKDINGSLTKIIDGTNSRVSSSKNLLKIKATKDNTNKWTLYSDVTGVGNNYTIEGAATDDTFTQSVFFGILVKQSTASFFQKHFFDDISIRPYAPDTIPPQIASVEAATSNTLNIIFNEPVDTSVAQNTSNYSINNGLGNPDSVILSTTNPAMVTLQFSAAFTNGVEQTVVVKNIADLAGNILANTNVKFTYSVPVRYDVVISEIMADPSPTVGLPDVEWIELKNTSKAAINLVGYKIGKPSGMSGAFPPIVLLPDSSLIVCGTSSIGAMSVYGKTIGVTSFPNLGNSSDVLILTAADGTLMHALQYSINWYQTATKANGGWSLEMIDPKNPCVADGNWKESIAPLGGSPSTINAVNGINTDKTAPKLVSAFASDDVHITLYFSEPLDSTSAANSTAYLVSDGINNPIAVVPQGPLYNMVNIELSTKLLQGKVYTVTVSEVLDCIGNKIASNNTASLAIATAADSFDVVINEILVNPKPLGQDYIELYNRSTKVIDLATLLIANRSSTTGDIGTPVKLTQNHYLLLPGAYVAFSANPAVTKQAYIVNNPDALLAIESLPSWPDDKGFAIILNSEGKIIDELNYADKWHHLLLDNVEGVALERIDFDKPTNDFSNWSSAAQSEGFGTPTYINSQYFVLPLPQGGITVNPKIFSPDNDGYEDFAYIQFLFPQPGFIVNITIFDAAGRPVHVLQRNTSAGTSGSFRWNGLNDKQQKVPIGTYIIYTEIFNLKGEKKSFKNMVVVARKF